MQTVPLTTWEQAGIIVLFCILILAVLGGLYVFIRSVLKQFTDFISTRDEQWQKYFEDRERSFRARNEEVVKVLQELVNKFQEHAQETTTAIAVMRERTRPTLKSKVKPLPGERPE